MTRFRLPVLSPASRIKLIVGGLYLGFAAFLALGTWVILLRQRSCHEYVARHHLAINHLVEAGDWLLRKPNALACAAVDKTPITDRYMLASVPEGGRFSYSQTAQEPTIAITAGHVLFWVPVPESVNTSFLEPGAEFDLCDRTGADCLTPPLRAEALRCAVASQKRTCNVAVIVPDSQAPSIRTAVLKTYQIVLRASPPPSRVPQPQVPGSPAQPSQPISPDQPSKTP